MLALDRLAVHFGQQNVSNGPKYWIRSAFQQIRQTNQKFPLSQPNRIVDIGKSEELNSQFGQRRTRPQLAISFLEKLEKPVPHTAGSLARVKIIRNFGRPVSLILCARGFIRFFMLPLFFFILQQLAMVFRASIEGIKCIFQ